MGESSPYWQCLREALIKDLMKKEKEIIRVVFILFCNLKKMLKLSEMLCPIICKTDGCED